MPSSPFADFMKAQGKNPLDLLPAEMRKALTAKKTPTPRKPTFNPNDPRLKAFLKFMIGTHASRN